MSCWSAVARQKTKGETVGGLAGSGVGMLIAPGAGLVTAPIGEKIGKSIEDDKAKEAARRQRQRDRDQYSNLKKNDPDAYRRFQGN